MCRSELDALDHLDAARELGLQPDAMAGIVQTLCEDLLLGAHASGSLLANFDDDAQASLMAAVTDPVLLGRVLRLTVAVANADRLFAAGEVIMLGGAAPPLAWR